MHHSHFSGGTLMPAQKESGGAEAPPPDLACDVSRY
jgi:hypothetical protein